MIQKATLCVYTSGGAATPGSGTVHGAGIGVGFTGGILNGSMEDFAGPTRENTTYTGPGSHTQMETQSGKQGNASSGGLGWASGYTSIETTTTILW